MPKRFFIVSILFVVAGCATPAQRIATKLGEYGVPPGQARCMGERLQDRLTVSQLKRLGELGAMTKDRLGQASINDIARLLSDPRDPTVAIELVRAGIGCAI